MKRKFTMIYSETKHSNSKTTKIPLVEIYSKCFGKESEQSNVRLIPCFFV